MAPLANYRQETLPDHPHADLGAGHRPWTSLLLASERDSPETVGVAARSPLGIEGHLAHSIKRRVLPLLVARQVFDEMPAAYQKRLIVDSKTELVFESNGAGRRVSRIISVPSKPPRGKKGDVLLDELGS